jgi:hypothetical protein
MMFQGLVGFTGRLAYLTSLACLAHTPKATIVHIFLRDVLHEASQCRKRRRYRTLVSHSRSARRTASLIALLTRCANARPSHTSTCVPLAASLQADTAKRRDCATSRRVSLAWTHIALSLERGMPSDVVPSMHKAKNCMHCLFMEAGSYLEPEPVLDVPRAIRQQKLVLKTHVREESFVVWFKHGSRRRCHRKFVESTHARLHTSLRLPCPYRPDEQDNGRDVRGLWIFRTVGGGSVYRQACRAGCSQR